MGECLTKENKPKGFLYSDLYLLLVFAVCFFGWHFKLENIGISVLALGIVLIMLFHDDFAPVLPIILAVCFIVPNRPASDYVSNNGLLYAIVVPIVVLSIIFFFIKNKKKIKLGPQFLGLMCLCVPYFLGGILYDFDIWARGILTTIALFGAVVVMYLMLRNGIKSFDKVYFAKICMYAGLLIVFETFSYFIFSGETFEVLLKRKSLHVGWGMSNIIGAMMLLCIPMTLYLSYKDKAHTPIAAVAFLLELVTLILTLSRASILAGLIGIPALFVYTAVKVKHKEYFFISYGAILAVLCAVILLCMDQASLIWERITIFEFTSEGMDVLDSGRLEIYAQAMKEFLLSPIYGVGAAFKFNHDGFNSYWYHNSFIQFMVNGGTIGLLGYIAHLFFKFKMLCARGSDVINKFILVALVIWELYGMLDCNYFVFCQPILMTMLLVFAERNLPKNYDIYSIFRRRGKKLDKKVKNNA